MQLALKRLIKLGIIVLGVFSISFGPFVLNGQISQVLLIYIYTIHIYMKFI